MNLIGLTDTKLAALYRQVTNEVERRARIAANGHDAAALVHGNEMAKRALVVAAAGGHSLLLVGPSACGKTMLRAVALELGLGQTFEVRPCPCGNFSTPYADCSCTARQIERHREKFPVADITVEVVRPPEREMRSAGTTLADMRKQIAAKTAHTALDLDDVASGLLRTAVAEVNVDPGARHRIITVARTIANLDRRERIEAPHLMEAVNYRGFLR